MNEFDTALSDVTEPVDVPQQVDALDLDLQDLSLDEPTDFTAEEPPDLPADEPLSDAEMAADYARSMGFDRAGDYIEQHYAGGEFVPGTPISVTTRNMALEGSEAENGVPFERRTADLADGLSVEGVFPVFDSRHRVELGPEANDMSLHQQFNACREDFQLHMYDQPEILQDMTIGQMERMEQPQGYSPQGWTWQHQPETGRFDLVLQKDHTVGHTGGNALWGRSGKDRSPS